jgi:hypothetical protein
VVPARHVDVEGAGGAAPSGADVVRVGIGQVEVLDPLGGELGLWLVIRKRGVFRLLSV